MLNIIKHESRTRQTYRHCRPSVRGSHVSKKNLMQTLELKPAPNLDTDYEMRYV